MSSAEVPARRVVALAGSAFVVLAAEPLYLLVDTAVVGHLGAIPLAGLGVASAFMAVLLLVGTFLQYGTTSRAARWFGAGDRGAAVREGVQASWLAVALGVAMIVLGQVVAGPVTRTLAGAAGPVAEAAESWLRIALFGMPGVLLVLAGNGWMRGVQETKAPVRIVLLANGLSAVAAPILVYPVGLGLVGSAVANVGAQVVGGALFLRALRREGVGVVPRWGVMRRQLVVGRDLLVRSIGFQVAFLTAAAVTARMGAAQIAAHQIGLQLWTFTALLLDSFAIAAQSLVGAALGSGDATAGRAVAWQVARYGLWAGVAFGAVYAAGYAVIPWVFSSSDEVVAQARVLWPWFVGMLPAAGVVFALDGVLIGAGDVRFMAGLTLLAGIGGYVPLTVAALYGGWGLGGVWAGLAAFVGVRLVGMVLRTRGTRWIVLGAQR